jgi:two-component system phosphate regulon sensor histidine kinase PhoR
MDIKPVPSIRGDGVRLAQVFENLFTNAMKYAPGSPIIVILNQVGRSMLVSFTDHGPGIPKESLPLIFERFYRVNKSGSRSEGGSGLGLSIVKHIIEAHKQTINVRSTQGQGSTFGFTLDKAQD